MANGEVSQVKLAFKPYQGHDVLNDEIPRAEIGIQNISGFCVARQMAIVHKWARHLNLVKRVVFLP